MRFTFLYNFYVDFINFMSTFNKICRLYVENSIDNQLDVELPTFKPKFYGRKNSVR